MTLFLGFSAVNTGNNLVYLVVSALLSFMGISGFFGKRNLSGIDIDIELPQEIYAGRDFPLKIRLKNNRAFLQAFLIKITIGKYETFFPFIDKKKEIINYINISFEARGRYKMDNLHICSVFPFNFFIRCKKINKSFEFIVFPKPEKCVLKSYFEKERIQKGEQPLDKIGYEADIISIREYIHGDPFKHISWKATAKTGELKTKDLSALSYQPIVIDFDTVNIRNTEEKLSCITYTVSHLFKLGIPVGLKIRNKLYKPGISISHKTNILKELALYDTEK
ncbi:MAG: DUF58 domain-containing protein [Thermodesulfovibrionales bacterium]|nr:DUF58 domain-containing protein [Thermodesulfovibrionales bacterium]